MDRGAWHATAHGVAELDMTEQHSTSTKCNLTDLSVIVSILVKYRKFDIFIYSVTVSSSLDLISSTLNFRIQRNNIPHPSSKQKNTSHLE